MATHQMYGQTGGASEPQIDQNMHNRNYYSTRYLYYFLLLFFISAHIHTHACAFKNKNIFNENIYF